MPPLSSLSRSLDGRGAVVTGAASGIGRATAELLVDLGCYVAIADLNEEGLQETASKIAAAHGQARVRAWKVDCSSSESLKEFAANASEFLGGSVYILVNNAGVIGSCPIGSKSYHKILEKNWLVNCAAQAHLTRFLLPELKADDGGRVVNISSTEGLGATLMNSPYTVAKHGVIGLTRALAVELGSQGVTVNAVCPGPIRTGITEGISDKHKQQFAKRLVPLRRYGYPEEVAHAVVSLCLPAMRWINGAILTADGGIMANNALLPSKLPWEEVTAEAKL
eukprot:TRINITY_DN22900_c0_g1_i1.p1 TRINITY_DN22900_c0_g1~~TRINITY_DN22900_c0_g1_i1.p1  ORF type:complete len:280 (+),score=66.48 TRINITY_DN22900_c0_g1_i1:75-914(+)